MMFPVRHKRVKPWEDKSVRMNGLTGYGWDDFVVTAGIQWGQKLVFTNLPNYTLSVVVIGGYDGLGLSEEDIRTTTLKRPPRPILNRDMNGKYKKKNSNFQFLIITKIMFYIYVADPRMHHICTWYHHAAHVNEDRVVYTRFKPDATHHYPLVRYTQ